MIIPYIKNSIKKFLGWESLSPQRQWSIKFFLFDCSTVVFNFFPLSLSFLCKFYKSDKWGVHFYTPVYEKLFGRLRYKTIKFLEIGVGGFEDRYSGGNSIFLWKSYFPFASMSFVDVVDKTHFSRKRVKVFHGSQGDSTFLERVAHESGMFDIIIDDGSHINEHQIETFKTLFPFLKDDGVYVVEDTQTSYWPSFGGGGLETEEYRKSCTRFFLDLVDGLNYGEFLDENYIPSEFNKKITEISFLHNLIIIKKGDNEQESVLTKPNTSKLRQSI